MTEHEIREILKQETRIPEIIEARMEETLYQICGEKTENSGVRKQNERGWGHYVKTALLAGVILAGTGTAVYAAARKFSAQSA